MLRDRMERARRLGVAEFADLEEIVAEVLASLDGEDPAGDEEPLALRRAIDKRAGPQRRTSAVPERREPPEVAEDGREQGSSAPEEGSEQVFTDHPDPPADAELPVDELYSRTEALAIAAEDADFVRQAAAWLATRPNVEQLLDRVRAAVFEYVNSQQFGEGNPGASPEGDKDG